MDMVLSLGDTFGKINNMTDTWSNFLSLHFTCDWLGAEMRWCITAFLSRGEIWILISPCLLTLLCISQESPPENEGWIFLSWLIMVKHPPPTTFLFFEGMSQSNAHLNKYTGITKHQTQIWLILILWAIVFLYASNISGLLEARLTSLENWKTFRPWKCKCSTKNNSCSASIDSQVSRFVLKSLTILN